MPPQAKKSPEDTMKQLLILMLALMAGRACSAEAPQADFNLSPEASDKRSVTLSAPDAGGTDSSLGDTGTSTRCGPLKKQSGNRLGWRKLSLCTVQASRLTCPVDRVICNMDPLLRYCMRLAILVPGRMNRGHTNTNVCRYLYFLSRGGPRSGA